MTSFVIRFMANVPGAFRGTVRHVRTGEESAFSSPSDLIQFFERLNAIEMTDPDEDPKETRPCEGRS